VALTVEKHAGGVALVRIEAEAAKNAFDAETMQEISDALNAQMDDHDVRAIILTGAGDRAFGAGQDLSESKTFDADRTELWMGEWKKLYACMRESSKPIIAALNGVAAGSAFQVALLCDLRVAHAGVRMGQPEILSGIPTVTGNWVMRDMIGIARTIDLTFTGRMLDAAEAYEWGLISRLVDENQVMAAAVELAELLASRPPVAMRLNRQRIREVTQEGFDDAMDAGVRIQLEAYGTGEPQRMMEEFFAKRAKA